MLELLHFIFVFCFVCSFVSNMIVEHESFSTFTTCQRKNQCGESSMFRIHNSTIVSSLFFFFVFFSEKHLLCIVFVNEHYYLTKKAFCFCPHALHVLISDLALSLIKPFNPSLSFVIWIQFQHYSK